MNTGRRKFFGDLPAVTVFVLVGAGVAGVLVVPQLVAVGVCAPHLFTEHRVGVFGLLGLWVMADPGRVTGSVLPGIVHHVAAWVTAGAVCAVCVVLVRVRLRYLADPQHLPGLAPARLVAKQLSANTLLREYGSVLRPGIPPHKLTAASCGYLVGSFLGGQVWVRAEDPMIIVGPSRAGKGWFLVLRWILEAPGAVITTSSKPDNAMLTMMQRERVSPGNVWVFAPGTVAGERFGRTLRFDPVAGCTDEHTLIRRIHALVPADVFSGSTSNGGHWDSLGQQLSAALFHAAACGGFTVDDIWRWVVSPARAREAVDAIRKHPGGLVEHANFLETVLHLPAEQRATQWGVLPTTLAFLSSRLSRAWMKPDPAQRFDPVTFLLECGTLYLIGDKHTTGGYTRVIDGLLAELDYVSKGLADAQGGRLDPPVTYLLDEAGNFEYQGLYELITAGGGRGRVGVAVFQAKEQLGQYGKDLVTTLWDAATVKLVLPGGADDTELRAMSQLIGDRWVDRKQRSYGHGPESVSVSEEKRAILEAADIRQLPAGHAILLYRNLGVIIPKLVPVSAHPTYRQCVADKQELTARMQAASPFACRLAERESVADHAAGSGVGG